MLSFWVYITASRRRVLYTGVTNDLVRRIYEHKEHLVPDFSSRYNVDRLVYFESAEEPLAAIAREKQIKGWSRRKKIALIERENSRWQDLSVGWF